MDHEEYRAESRARWEEAAIARSLGFPVDRVYFVELSGDDD